MIVRCWYCPEDAPAPTAELVLTAVPERPGTAVLRHVCPDCLTSRALRPAAEAPAGGGLAAVLTAGSAVLMVALVATRR